MNENQKPLYVQLADNMRNKIISGEYRVGSKIMSERQMAEIYGLNRLTVRKSIEQLIQEGYLSAVQGKGTFVERMTDGGKKMQFGSSEIMSLSSQLRQSGFSSSRTVLSFKKIKSEKVLKDFFPNSAECYELIRLSKIDNNPYALQICYFPASVFHRPERFDFSSGSIYDYMESQGHRPKTMISEMTAVPVPSDYSEILAIEKGKLIFFYEYFGFDIDHKMVEYTRSYYVPEYTSFKYSTEK